MSVTLEDILQEVNIELAISELEKRKDTAGSDGVKPSQLRDYWKLNKVDFLTLIKEGKYEPTVVQTFEQLNKNKKIRTIMLMTAVDRMLARAVSQALSEELDRGFSKCSYAYRKNLGTADIAQFIANQIERRRIWCVEADVENFLTTYNIRVCTKNLKKE